MNKIVMLAIAATTVFASTSASSDTYVRGYTRDNGTYVQPYVRSDRNDSREDNYSSKGNTNPYTGQRGSVDTDRDSGLKPRRKYSDD